MDNFQLIVVISLNAIVGLMLLRLLLRLLGYQLQCKQCHRQILHGDYSWCRECSSVYYQGERLGRDGLTDSQRAMVVRGGYRPMPPCARPSPPVAPPMAPGQRNEKYS